MFLQCVSWTRPIFHTLRFIYTPLLAFCVSVYSIRTRWHHNFNNVYHYHHNLNYSAKFCVCVISFKKAINILVKCVWHRRYRSTCNIYVKIRTFKPIQLIFRILKDALILQSIECKITVTMICSFPILKCFYSCKTA